jgi:hypothetical protein
MCLPGLNSETDGGRSVTHSFGFLADVSSGRSFRGEKSSATAQFQRRPRCTDRVLRLRVTTVAEIAKLNLQSRFSRRSRNRQGARCLFVNRQFVICAALTHSPRRSLTVTPQPECRVPAKRSKICLFYCGVVVSLLLPLQPSSHRRCRRRLQQ